MRKYFLVFAFLGFVSNNRALAQSQEAPAQGQTDRVGEIDPNKKAKYQTRYEAKNSSTFSFGPGFAINLNNSNMLYALALGYEWETGSRGAVITQLAGAFGSSTAYTEGIIGGKFYFTDTDVSPYIKGGFGMAAAKGADLDLKGGFSGNIGVGITMFRTSTVHLEGVLQYSALFASNDKGSPGVGSAQIQISY